MSTLEFIIIAVLVIVVGIAIWNMAIILNYSLYLRNFSYSRGANASEGENVTLSCESGGEICVYRATQVCTNPNSENFETSNLDPIDTSPNNYGNFNPNTTVDLTQQIGAMCNGKNTSNFTFNPNWGQNTCNGKSQLIATYSCIPSGSTCQSWK